MLPDMSPGEKAQRLQRVVSDLTNIYPGIEKTPGVCGGMPAWQIPGFRCGR